MAMQNRDYDEVPYPPYVHAQTHPDRLSVIGMLAGMHPAPVEHCRVLELGCGDGSNLIPMAVVLTGSEFIGIDRASTPIEKGQAALAELQLKNISLERLDVMDLAPDLGPFDYIIVHGMYAWVPPEVKQQIMSICRTHLKPHGIAYISYNAYPGGHISEMVRNMLLFHLRDVSDPKQRITQSIAFLKFLRQSQTRSSSYNSMLDEELEQALKSATGLLFHDRIGAISTPLYFFQFMNEAAEHGLQFLGEADFFETQYHIYPPETAKLLKTMASESVILKEQYLDFIKCRRFRQTLLCHSEVELSPAASPQSIINLHISSRAKPAKAVVDFSPGKVAEFIGPHGGKVATDLPIAKAALSHLAQLHPYPVSFAELIANARQLARLPNAENEASDVEALSTILLSIYGTGLLELYPRAPDYVAKAGEYPEASLLVRTQVERATTVTNLRHATIDVEDEVGRQLLRLLDGSRNRSQIVEDLTQAIIAGDFLRGETGEPIRDRAKVREIMVEGLERNLQRLADVALLVQ